MKRQNGDHATGKIVIPCPRYALDGEPPVVQKMAFPGIGERLAVQACVRDDKIVLGGVKPWLFPGRKALELLAFLKVLGKDNVHVAVEGWSYFAPGHHTFIVDSVMFYATDQQRREVAKLVKAMEKDVSVALAILEDLGVKVR